MATEAFFEKPREMCARHPELYSVLSEYYGQDPAARDRAEIPGQQQKTSAGRKPHRDSRVAAAVEVHNRIAGDWPGWVRFWEIHPGVSRAQALQPLESHIMYAIGFFVLGALFVVQSSLDWGLQSAMLIMFALAVTMIGLAVWLRLAVRWVDRHGVWGGDYRPPIALPSGPESDRKPTE